MISHQQAATSLDARSVAFLIVGQPCSIQNARRQKHMAEFKLDPNANASGTHLVGEIELPPKQLVDAFGEPGEGDDYKVSGMYIFTDDGGNVFTVYDWKATSLFEEGSDPDEEDFAMSPEAFWGNWNPETLNIGGHDKTNVEAFKSWLLAQLGSW